MLANYASRVFLRGELGGRSRSKDGKFILEVAYSGLECVSLLQNIPKLWQGETRSLRIIFVIDYFPLQTWCLTQLLTLHGCFSQLPLKLVKVSLLIVHLREKTIHLSPFLTSILLHGLSQDCHLKTLVYTSVLTKSYLFCKMAIFYYRVKLCATLSKVYIYPIFHRSHF